MKRPLLSVVLLFASGILLARFITLPLIPVLSVALSLAVLALAWSRARPYLLKALILLAGCSNLVVRTTILSPNDLRSVLENRTELLQVRGTLHDTPSPRHYEMAGQKESWRSLAKLDVSALRLEQQDWRPASGRMMVTASGELTNFFAGQRVELTGVGRRPRTAVAEEMFDYRAYLADQGIYYQLQTESDQDWRVLASPSSAPLSDRFRAWARQALALGRSGEDEALRLEWALTLGWKAALTEEVAQPFVRAATYHIFAVDGLRMGIVFVILFGLCRALHLPRALAGALLLPAIWFYVALTGWPASAIRATVMLTIIIIGWMLKRPSDLLNSLFAAALILLAYEPRELFQAGFQLSFLVVLCIVLILPRLRELGDLVAAPEPLALEEFVPRWRLVLRRLRHHVQNLGLTSLAAWLASLPLVAYYFHLITPVSTPANMLAVPLCAVVLMSNITSLLLAAWFPAAAALFNHAGWFFMQLIRVTSRWFAAWPAAYFFLPAPGLFTVIVYYCALLASLTGWLFELRRRRLKIALLSVALLAWGLHCWHQAIVPRLTVLAFSGGHAVYSDEFGARHDLLINCGTTNAVAMVTEPFLRAQGVNRLAALALTHGDSHQVGGAKKIVDEFSVRQICASPVHFRSPVYREILDDLEPGPAKVRTLTRGDSVGRWKVLHPDPADHFAQADDNALVFLGDFGGTQVLLLSDLGRAGQQALAARMVGLHADLVVTGMPVAGEPLCNALLDAVQPRVIIVADSELPVAKRAGPKLCQRLAQRNVPIIYTRVDGSATVDFRAANWELRTMSGTVLRGTGLPHRGPPNEISQGNSP